MRRALWAASAAVMVLAGLGAPHAWAGPSGSGAPRWTATYDEGGSAYSDAVTVSPDGTQVFVTGVDHFSDGHMATLAYDAATGHRDWAAVFPGASSSEFGYGRALTVSHDGSTVFVTGWSSCQKCGDSGFQGTNTIAYDATTGSREWVAREPSDGGGPNSIELSPDGSELFVVGVTGSGTQYSTTTIAYSPTTGQRLWIDKTDAGLGLYGTGAAVSADGSTIYVTGPAGPDDDTSCFFTAGYLTTAYRTSDGTSEWTKVYSMPGSDICGAPTDMALSADGSTVYVTGYGGVGTNRLQYEGGTVAYDAETGAQLWGVTNHDFNDVGGDTAAFVAVSPDGSKVYTSGDDCGKSYYPCPYTTTAYDSATGGRLWASTYDTGGRGFEADFAVSPDGSTLLLTGQMDTPCYAGCPFSRVDAPLVAYDADTGAERWATTYQDNEGAALAISPDSRSVYLAGSFTSSSSISTTRGETGRGSQQCSPCGISTTRFNTGPGPGIIQDTEPSLRYDGWKGIYDKTAWGGAYRESRSAGETATFTSPKATSVSWLTHLGPNQGRARLTIDGHRKGTFDLYRSTASAHAFTFSGLARRHHTVKVTVLGRKDASSRGAWVVVDGFQFHGGRGFAEESSPGVRFDSWAGASGHAFSGGTFRASGTRSAKVTLAFRGRTVRWLTATGPSYGRARVVIDGRAHIVDLYRPHQHKRVAIVFHHLGKGAHHLEIRPLGRKDRASSSATVVVDALVVRRH